MPSGVNAVTPLTMAVTRTYGQAVASGLGERGGVRDVILQGGLAAPVSVAIKVGALARVVGVDWRWLQCM